MPETLPATATVTASSIDCTVAVLKVPTPTLQLPEVCNLQSLGLIMEPNNINIELNPAALVTPAMEPVGFKDRYALISGWSQIKEAQCARPYRIDYQDPRI
ncbi:GD10639 [Drosophila simulans]|uniref:GD10639 n=1 Tax=Drosophila simulans TaxID=7240 RepID=B4NV74_DROSI|nr:GD10639 [Drosophila simulans]